MVFVGVLVVCVVRPAAGATGLLGCVHIPWRERSAIGYFGIRGVESLYYLSYAINEVEFAGKESLWSLVAFVIVLSIIIHGIAGAPVMGILDRRRARTSI